MEEPQPTYDELRTLVDQLREQNRQLQARLATLEAELSEAKQAAARQAAPFRRREQLKRSADEKKKPGRKPGHPGHFRIAPVEIDETIESPLVGCPQRQMALEQCRRLEQVVEELPAFRPRRIKLVPHEGVCPRHGLVRSTHPLQTSTAVGAAGTHLGPRAQAVADQGLLWIAIN